MNNFRLIENLAPQLWDEFVATHAGHLLQTSMWGELKTRFGWSVRRVALARDETLVAGAQMLIRRLPFGWRFAYVPRGPVADPHDTDTLGVLLNVLCRYARVQRVFALKIEPNWLEGTAPSLSMLNSSRPASSIQPRTTFHLDLTPDLDTILARMKPKWRYNIRLAERKGVTVRVGTADDLTTFYRLLQITSARDRFAIHESAYYRTAFELFVARDHARLFVAEYAGEPLAMIFVTVFGGEAIYLYGASSNAHRERMPNHALHWEAMRWAKARGCTRYDLWGVGATSDADARAGHGLYQFKQGFGGQLVRYTEARDVVFSRGQYALYNQVVAWRRARAAIG